jgi:hypothetical protein
MATAVFAETLDNSQYSMRLIHEIRSVTTNASRETPRQGHESLFVFAHHTDCGPSSCLSSEDWGLIILCLSQERYWCKQRCRIRLHTTCSRRPLTAEAQVQVGSVVVKLPLGHVIQFFGFPQSVSFHRGSPYLHTKQSLLMAVVQRHSLIPSDIITF